MSIQMVVVRLRAILARQEIAAVERSQLQLVVHIKKSTIA
jgi:hypothetical protein